MLKEYKWDYNIHGGGGGGYETVLKFWIAFKR